jgi:serine protease Do
MKRGFSYAAVAVIMFAAGMLVVSAGGSWFGLEKQTSAESFASPEPSSVPPSSALEFEEAFLQVAEKVNPAVVQISSSKRVRQPANPFRWNPWFEEFFGRPQDEGPGESPEGEERYQLQQGLGSGAIVRPDGYIVTNRHVIDEADDLEVRLFDGREYEARVVGSDQLSDLAVIKIEIDEPLPFIDSGAGSDVRVGQWVLAFGSPLSTNLSNTVTAGIVSAIGRFSQGNRIEDFIQTDAAINPGNSGGPLVNLNGQLVGINTAIYTQTGGYQGIGLAIPIRTVESVIEQLIDSGRVRRGYLGIRFSPISESLSKALDVPRGSAQVAGVEEDGAAAEAGIEEGDVIVAIDGKDLVNANELLAIVATAAPGDELELEIVREDSRRTFKVELGERPDDLAASESLEGESERGEGLESIENELGFEMATIDRDLALRFGLDESLRGVLLTNVEQSSEAFQDADIRSRDVIVEADRKPVESVADFVDIYTEIEPGDTFLVRVNRGEATFLTALTKPE